ncbi:MAG: methyltransferase domain-containing protein [Alphaproteobacteria bacterium]|nr:methyltransferase domain-containing protein [Alphaproteobacteria bacterium]
MRNVAARRVETCVVELLDTLGIESVHIAAGRLGLTDWQGLATTHPDRVASITLINPPIVDAGGLRGLASRMLSIAGDIGSTAEGAVRLLHELPEVTFHLLHGFECHPWSDVIADHGSEIGAAILGFLARHPVAAVPLHEREGERAGVSYRIRGTGPPLVLMPLDLAPSQWEPLIPILGAHYSTITLGGPLLGAVGLLEARGRSTYLGLVRTMLDLSHIQPGEVILEVGGGSGVVLRELARRTAGSNPILAIDINPYLLREAAALAKAAGLAARMTFQEGSAEAIPLAADSVDIAFSFTVMEEGDADRMLAELVRVTRPGGRIAVIVRSRDLPSWANLPISAALRAKVDKPGLIGAGVAAAGCADASLYSRFYAAGLTELKCFPQLVAITPAEVSRFAISQQQILAMLTADEAAEWRSAAARAAAEGTFFIATGHHCAVGTKPA